MGRLEPYRDRFRYRADGRAARRTGGGDGRAGGAPGLRPEELKKYRFDEG
jgi:hypothetical protein